MKKIQPPKTAVAPITQLSTDSSCLIGIGYESHQEVLEVTFPTGDVYQYFEVPPRVYLELLVADSKGKFYNRHIKGTYEAQWVRSL